MDKKALRALIREKKRAMTPEEMEERSAALGRLLAQTAVYQAAKTVYGYYPQNQEVRLLPILAQAMAEGKKVALPKITGEKWRFSM